MRDESRWRGATMKDENGQGANPHPRSLSLAKGEGGRSGEASLTAIFRAEIVAYRSALPAATPASACTGWRNQAQAKNTIPSATTIAAIT